MRKRLRKAAESADVNMTPMLDIVFILLIFFIVTATFLQEQGITMVQPPPPDEPQQTEPLPTILIQVDQRNLIFICFPTPRDCQLSDVDRVTANVQRFIVEAGGQAGVAIQPHPDALHGVVTKVYDNAQTASPAGILVRDPQLAVGGAA